MFYVRLGKRSFLFQRNLLKTKEKAFQNSPKKSYVLSMTPSTSSVTLHPIN
jgi:hypothetical protein